MKWDSSLSLPRNNLLQTPSFRHDPAPEGKNHALLPSGAEISPAHKKAVITIQLETPHSVITALHSAVRILLSNILEEEHTSFATLVSVIWIKIQFQDFLLSDERHHHMEKRSYFSSLETALITLK